MNRITSRGRNDPPYYIHTPPIPGTLSTGTVELSPPLLSIRLRHYYSRAYEVCCCDATSPDSRTCQPSIGKSRETISFAGGEYRTFRSRGEQEGIALCGYTSIAYTSTEKTKESVWVDGHLALHIPAVGSGLDHLQPDTGRQHAEKLGGGTHLGGG